MKLKPILASLMLLGLAAPAFADTANASTQAQIDSMKAQLNKMEAVVNQNGAGGFQQASDWTSRITISGLLNVNGYYSNTTANFGIPTVETSTRLDDTDVEVAHTKSKGGHTNSIAVNNANLFVDALVNDWTNVHIGLLYNTGIRSEFSRETAVSKPTFDEAYVTLANFSESPVFLRAGREYLPFGVYNRFPMVQNPTQLLSETSGNAAQVGFVSPAGVYASVYGFRGISKNTDRVSVPRTNNWGADLGYAYTNAVFGMKLDAGYLHNIGDVDYVSTSQGMATLAANEQMNGLVPAKVYTNRSGGLALSADGTMGPFDVSLRYVKALQAMQQVHAYTNGGKTSYHAEPSALGAELGYSFPVAAHQSRVGLGYQHTYNSAAGTKPVHFNIDNDDGTHTHVTTGLNTGVGAYGLPLTRIYANYNVNVSKWTDVGVEVYHDKNYAISRGGSHSAATVGVVQLGVKFA